NQCGRKAQRRAIGRRPCGRLIYGWEGKETFSGAALPRQDFAPGTRGRAKHQWQACSGLETGEDFLSQGGFFQGAGNRLLQPDFAGAVAPPYGSAHHTQTPSRRCRGRTFLRKTLSLLSASVGADGADLERPERKRNQ